jgi:hypothetical protein
MVEVQTIRIVRRIDAACPTPQELLLRERFVQMLVDQREYKKRMGYDVLNGEVNHDRRLVHHRGMLKKYIESDLYINLQKKKDGVAVEHLMYSIAAGVAMIFATGIAWYFQMKYGNITWPLFVVVVVSYMLKDRIKDLLRYYFAHRLGNKYYDKKAIIAIGNTNVGTIKEGFDFISDTKIPDEVKSLREKSSFVEGESNIFEEKVLLYRQRVTLDENALAVKDQYTRQGINEIFRLHLNRFTHKMDNPQVKVDAMDESGNISTFSVQKIYYVNVVFQLVHDNKIQYRQFRIGMTRDGVLDVEQI